jgi:allantoinase
MKKGRYKMDLIIKSDNIVFPDYIDKGVLYVKDEKIVGLSQCGTVPKTAELIDATNKVVFPGVLDPHVHAREPGTEQREDFFTCSCGAAAGGVTTILEQPLSVPPTWNVDHLLAKKKLASEKSIVDFALYGGAGITSLEYIESLAAEGVCAFKTFLHAPPLGREKEWEGIYSTNDGALIEVFERVATTGILECVHAENDAIITWLEQKMRAKGRVDPMAYVEASPVVSEVEAIQRCALFAEYTGVRLHVLHVSCAEGIEIVKEKKERGHKNMTVETCPHYLCINDEHVKKMGPYARIKPPIRTKSQNERIWKLLANGWVDTIGSDHGPHTKESKERGWKNIFKASSGTAGVEQMLPIMLTGVNEGKCNLNLLSKVMCENVAKLYGLYPKKGSIRIGADADIIIIDLNKRHTFRAQDFRVKAKDGAMLYDGLQVIGMPETTIIRGKVVFHKGEIKVPRGYGQFVARQDSKSTREENVTK